MALVIRFELSHQQGWHQFDDEKVFSSYYLWTGIEALIFSIIETTLINSISFISNFL